MKLIADLHCHTTASTHAFSTLNEMTACAREMGLRALAITDHGVAMPDAPYPWYFHTLRQLPSVLWDDFLLLKGVEANAIDASGAIDMPPEEMELLDWVIVSLHAKCLPKLSYDEATQMWLAVAQNPRVDMIGHCEEQKFRFDYDTVTREFAKRGKVVELNAGSAMSRPGNEENLRELALCCKRNGTPVAVTSDAHSTYALRCTQKLLPLLRELDFPEELVVNSSMERLADVLRAHGRPVAEIARQLV